MSSDRDQALLSATAIALARHSTPLAQQPPHGQDPHGVLDDVYEFVSVELRGDDPESELLISFRQAVRPDCTFVASSGPLWTDIDSEDPLIEPNFSWDDNAETIAAWLEGGIFTWGLPREEQADADGRLVVPWTLRSITRGD